MRQTQIEGHSAKQLPWNLQKCQFYEKWGKEWVNELFQLKEITKT